MKNFIFLIMAVLLVSCGGKGDSTVYPVPTELETGTWINTDYFNVTREIVFNADKSFDVSTTPAGGTTTTEKFWSSPGTKTMFLARRPGRSDTYWTFSNLTSNTVTFCVALYDDNAYGSTTLNGCKAYTR